MILWNQQFGSAQQSSADFCWDSLIWTAAGSEEAGWLMIGTPQLFSCGFSFFNGLVNLLTWWLQGTQEHQEGKTLMCGNFWNFCFWYNCHSLSKTSPVANPRVSVGEHYTRAWIEDVWTNEAIPVVNPLQFPWCQDYIVPIFLFLAYTMSLA